MLSTGGGKFALHSYTFYGYIPLVAADINGDGYNDGLFHNFTGGSQLFDIGYGDGKGNFPTIKAFPNLPGLTAGEQALAQVVSTDVNAMARANIDTQT